MPPRTIKDKIMTFNFFIFRVLLKHGYL